MKIRLADGYITYNADGVQVDAVVFEHQEYASVAEAYKACVDHALRCLRAGDAVIDDVDENTIYYTLDGEERREDVVLYDEEGEAMTYERGYWYAVMTGEDDTDWGYGTNDLMQAYDMLRAYPGGYIAKIDDGDDPVCVEEIEVPVFKDKGGTMVVPGDVLMDENGLYRVEAVEERGVGVVEVEIDEDGNTEVAGPEVTLTRNEVKNREMI